MKNNLVRNSPEIHLIRGPNILANIDSLTASAIVHGDGKAQVDISELEIGEYPRVIIHAHGSVSQGKHQLGLYSSLGHQSGVDYTSYSFQALAKATGRKPVNVELFSCYGGYAINDITALSKGSTLMTFVDDKYIMLNSVISELQIKSLNFQQQDNQFTRFASFLATNADTNRFAINFGSESRIFNSNIDELKDFSIENIKDWQKKEIIKFVEFLWECKENINGLNQEKIQQFNALIHDDKALNEFIDSFDIERYKEILLLNLIIKERKLLIESLLDNGDMDVNYIEEAARGEVTDFPLLIAALIENKEIAQLLLDRGAEVNKANKYGNTALHFAAQDGRNELLSMLIERGANVNAKDGFGNTVLYYAFKNKQFIAIETLIKNGANINRERQDVETPLCDAAYKGYKEIVHMLLDKGAEVDKARKDGVTPLLSAARNGHKEIVQMLLNKGAEVNKVNKDGVTPLFIAAKNGHEEIVQLLLDKGADIDKERKDGSTPLIAAAKNGHKEIAKLLLKKKIEASKLNEDGISPLLDAALNGDAKIVELLLEMGENVNKADRNGITPLIAAVRNGDATIVKMLLVKGANVDRADKNDETPLIAATYNGHAEIVQLLLVKRPNVNRVDRDGEAPLYVAASNGDIKIVELLVKAGAKTDDLVKNKSNKTISKMIVNIINQADENSSGWKLVEEMMKKVSVERRMEIATEVLKDSNQDSKAKFLGLFRNSNMSHAERLSLERAARPKSNIIK
jgi:ankyrin repeat protein